MSIEAIYDRQAFAEMWASDEIAEADSPSYKAPDGELFRVARVNRDGSVLSDSGRTFTASQFNQCERVTP